MRKLPEELLKNCSLVVAISSTTGLEAAFYKKPSIIFADTDYSKLKSVSKIEKIEDLPNVIRSQLKKEIDIADLNKYVNTIEKNSFEFDISELELSYHQYFYHGGYLVDVDITIDKMRDFINQNNQIIEKITEKHIEKILEYKKLKN